MKLKFRLCWSPLQHQFRWFRLSSTFLFISLILSPNLVSSLRIRIGNTHSGEYGVGPPPSPLESPLTLRQINSQNSQSISQYQNQNQNQVPVQNYGIPQNLYHTRVIRPVLTLDDSNSNSNAGGERGRLRTRVIPLSPSPTVPSPAPPAPSDLLLQYYRRTQANSNPNPSLKTVILTPLGDETETDQEKQKEKQISSIEDDEDEDDQQSIEYQETDQEQDQEQESTTVRATQYTQHQIPAALRRNFGHSLKSSSSDIEITTTKKSKDKDVEATTKPSRKKNKNKNSSSSSSSSGNGNSDSNSSTRRRKVKRPNKNKDKLKSTTLKVPSVVELGDENSPMDDNGNGNGNGNSNTNSNSTGGSSGGDKNLALEIGSDDGKYALIDAFFNQTEVEQPGILSYRPSEDFIKDNEKTLGNLNQNEIWLSEGHLLVLKGGDFDASNKEVWPSIDNYQRKKKPPPLQIPLDTDNPPPFPVFVNDSGPPVFLAEPPPFPYPPPGYELNGNETFDPSRLPPPGLIPLNPNGTIPRLPFPPGPGFGPLSGPPTGIFRPGQPIGGVNNNGGFGVNQGPAAGFGGFGGKNKNRIPPPLFGPFGPGGPGNGPPPPGYRPGNGNGPPGGPQNFPPPPPGYNQNFNGSGPPPGFPFLPPLVLNPADNETDDPSIFLPPPYDFDYDLDNSSLVAPGPFAPGLVVPPPKDFYSVYNRSGRPPPPPISAQTPTTTTSLFFFPGPTAPSTGPGGVTKKQRPNGKKPKFPITNPPDDSLEENYPPPPPSSPISLLDTTPLPETIYTTTGKNGKKRKQRPKKPFFPDDIPVIEIGSIPESPPPPSSPPSTPKYAIKIQGTGKFYGDSGISSSNEESDEKTTPPNVTFRPATVFFPKYNSRGNTQTSTSTPDYISQVIPIYKSIISSSTPKTRSKTQTAEKVTATTTKATPTVPTTVKSLNNFVYVRGQLKTLEEIAAEQAAEDEFESDKVHQGPPTPRPPFDSRGYPTRVLNNDDNNPVIFDFPPQKKTERKPTQAPLKTYYQGTPKYEPTYIPYSNPGKLQNSNGNVNVNPISINNNNNYPYLNRPPQQQQQQQPILLQSPPTRARGPQPPTILYPSNVYNNANNNNNIKNNNNNNGGRIRGGNRNYNNNNNQNQGVFINPQSGNGQLLNIGPTYYTQVQPQQQPESPQIQYNNNGQNINLNSGFRPAFPPPTPTNPSRGSNRARVLFPGQVAHQQIEFSPFGNNNNNNGGNNNNNNQNIRIPLYPNQNQNSNQFNGGKKRPENTGLPTFAPNGYYNPITNYQVNLNQQGPIQNGGGGGFSAPFIPSNQYFSPVQQQSQPKISNVGNYNFQSDPTVPVNNYNRQQQQQQPIQIYQNPQQQQQPQFQPFNNNNNRNRNNNNNSNQRLNQFVQPLYDDLRINFREPIPPYNAESESVTTRTVLKAGPSASPGDKTASPSLNFYSFTRNGPGGFSYKIQL